MKEILLAIEFIHDRGLIHCDLKPEKIFIDSDLKLKIAGFGSVRRILDDTVLSPVIIRQYYGCLHNYKLHHVYMTFASFFR